MLAVALGTQFNLVQTKREQERCAATAESVRGMGGRDKQKAVEGTVEQLEEGAGTAALRGAAGGGLLNGRGPRAFMYGWALIGVVHRMALQGRVLQESGRTDGRRFEQAGELPPGPG